MRGNLANEDRSDLIRSTLETNGRVGITDLAQRLAVSEMTIRRDLERLESEGVARRVRGGAVALGPAPFEERHLHQAHAKAKIAHKLLALVPDRGAIGIDASSTLLRLATALDAARDLTVITNGLETFATLRDKAGITPLLTGGQVEPRTGSLVGPLACRSARDLLLERLFVSAAAVSLEFGASEASLAEAEVKRAMGSVAGAVVVAVDSTKLQSAALGHSFQWQRVDLLVTELDPIDLRLEPYREVVELL